MQRRTLLAAVPVALAGCARSTGQDDAPEADTSGDGAIDTTTTDALDPEAFEDELVAAINTERHAAGHPNLGRDRGLRVAAREHSRDMHEREFYRHQNPDGEEPWDRVPCDAAETIHRGEIGEARNVDSEQVWDTTDVEKAVGYVIEGWILSREHFQIMTDGRFEQVGVGVHVADGEFWATAKYC